MIQRLFGGRNNEFFSILPDSYECGNGWRIENDEYDGTFRTYIRMPLHDYVDTFDAYCSMADARIKEVRFNGPATIVFWKDGTKTVAKCMPEDEYDREKGLMAAICKKFIGSEDLNDALMKWCHGKRAEKR